MELKSPQAFYNDCIEKLHNKAQEKGMANNYIEIPELIPLGQQAVLQFLKDPAFHAQYDNEPIKYYYLIFSLSIETGIVYANKWHENFNDLQNYVNQIMEYGPANDASILMNEYFPKDLSKDQGNPFFSFLYETWLDLHEPYWSLQDPRDYTFLVMLAGYQLGVSLILNIYGY